MSLMEPTKKNGALYIDPVFDKKQHWIWTSDREHSQFFAKSTVNAVVPAAWRGRDARDPSKEHENEALSTKFTKNWECSPSDLNSASRAWVVSFGYGICYNLLDVSGLNTYVRAVR